MRNLKYTSSQRMSAIDSGMHETLFFLTGHILPEKIKKLEF